VLAGGLAAILPSSAFADDQVSLQVVVSHETPRSIAEPTLRAAWIAAQAFAARHHLRYELFEPNDHPYDCPTWNETKLELRKCDGSGQKLVEAASLPTTRPVDVYDMQRSMQGAFAALDAEIDAHHRDFFIRPIRL
jgi:hypothetical protein